MNRHLPALPPASALLLAACVAQGPFPSLAPRPAELEDMSVEPVRPPVAVASDAALRRRVAELRDQAGRGDRAFDAAYGPAEAAVRRSGSEGSESWTEAQQAVSRLEAARAAAAAAGAELDRLALDRSDQPTAAEDFSAINDAIALVDGIAAAQQARIDRLRTRLSPR